MKFTFPIQKADGLLESFRYADVTWEQRLAKIAVITQAGISGLVLVLTWRLLPPKIPLWYSKPWGEERLTSPFFLLLPVITAVVVYMLNHRMAVRTAKDHPMFARVLSLTSVFISAISTIIVLRTITLIS